MSDVKTKEAASVSEEIAVLRQDITRLSNAVADLVKHEAGHARHRVEDVVVDLYNESRAALGQAGTRAKGLGEELNHTIERNPATSVLAALGIGLVIGLLSRGRH
ncbi:hypothetical protein GCM10011611_04680 [Aliidongia dinghuensis]|uniref:DUF883 domain-containing protein n=1 Tax=Aliidongia dinghuensis TaxID=1867774 RepID=A0A8J2YPY8_9PROT|nr:DUF883 family protein [Aliidongia dinghuensis]GGF02279.1 hypothetical protein GCM10011611_04680 [Aliidongia dinghuensis]